MYFFLLSIKETDNYYSTADEILASAQEITTHTHIHQSCKHIYRDVRTTEVLLYLLLFL